MADRRVRGDFVQGVFDLLVYSNGDLNVAAACCRVVEDLVSVVLRVR